MRLIRQYRYPKNDLIDYIYKYYMELDSRIINIYNDLKRIYMDSENIYVYKLIENIEDIKEILDSYYINLIDDRYDKTFNFKKELNKVNNIYRFSIKNIEFFDIYILYDDLNYCFNIIKIIDVFSRHILNGDKEKIKIVKSRLGDRKKFPIFIFPNNIKRNLAGKFFSENHLDFYKKTNQAFTTSGMTGDYMVITKKEELIKLLLHELIHFYKLDGTIDKHGSSLGKWRNNMPFNDYNGEEECIAELLSNIYNSMFVSIITLRDLKDLIYDEQQYSHYVIAKILLYFRLKPKNIFESTKKKVDLVSPINLYHIFKSIVFDNIYILLECNTKTNIFNISKYVYKYIHKKMPYLMQKFINDIDGQYNYVQKNYAVINTNVSYIKHDIDLERISIKNKIQKGGSYSEVYRDKYLKYKKKYILEKLRKI